jgi:ubiquinone/menaquinone biosynthesis C-methylase UbiE
VDDHERRRTSLAAFVADRERTVTKPSPDTQRWKELDAASYDGVAEAFDRHSQRLSGKAAERLAGLAHVGPRDRVLDVGTGTGLLPFSLARAKEPPASILGIDISAGMIETARRRLRDELHGDPRLRFERMDAEQLELPDASFDVVLSGFALTHVPRPELAMREIFRVLAPGGRIGVALGSRPPAGSGAQLRHAVAEVRRRIEAMRGRRLTADLLDRIVDRRIGRSVDVPEGAPLATQLNRVPLLRTLVRGAGFTDVAVSWRNYQNEIESADEFWDLHRTIRSDSRKRLLVAPAGVEQEVRREFMDECRKTLERGGVMTFPISVVFVTARKPDPAS